MRINKRFQEYIDTRINRWVELTGRGTRIDFPLSNADVKVIGDALSGDLSPENLHCDGEISRAQAQRKYNKLMNVVKDLNNYAEKKGLNSPNIYY
jgi:hypothetical protein